MKKISIAFVAVLSLTAFGCKKKGGDCDKAVTNATDVMKTDMKGMGMDDKKMDEIKGIAMQHCKDDKWPEDVIKCMADAKTAPDSEACRHQLPQEMQDKVRKDMQGVMGGMGGHMGGHEGMGHEGGGSAAPGGSGDMAPPAGGAAPGGSGDMAPPAGGAAPAGGGSAPAPAPAPAPAGSAK